ncbi:MAG: polysaccharide deacetylase family protein, partial [Proteobacteria bacterium]|nr:polysaccharide deacetylase family protein [Pseudomonadota bacterium]
APAALRAEPVALTFDDLPLNGTLVPGTSEVDVARAAIAVLRRQHVPPVVGFVNGAKLEGRPAAAAALRLWVDAGFAVGNHTYRHIDLSEVSAARFLEDAATNEPVLELLAGAAGTAWFRYPYLREGDTREKRDAVRAGLAARGYRIAQVTLDYEDYAWNSPYARCRAAGDAAALRWLRASYLETAAAYLDGARRAAQQAFGRPISHVLLLHLGAYSGEILPDLLALLRAKGYTLATLEEVARDPALASNPDWPSAGGGTLLEQWLEARAQPYPPVPPKPFAALEALCRAAAAPGARALRN